jgi:hypothetical protein
MDAPFLAHALLESDIRTNVDKSSAPLVAYPCRLDGAHIESAGRE